MKKPLINPRVLVSPVSDGYVVYDVDSNRLHELNPTAALLLELCDGSRSREEISEIAVQVLPDGSDGVVADWITQAEDAGLLVDGVGVDPAAVRQMSAAELVRLAAKLRDDGLIQAAYLCQEHAVALAPDDAPELRELGELAHIVGKRLEAREAYEAYLKLVPYDAEVRHLLTSLRDERPPARVPNECIRQLYQRFSSFYESNMCGELGYEGPAHLSAVIEEALGDRTDLNVLDLGCGTGLAGLALQHRARRLIGVDLSPEMIKQAKARGIYDELHVAEVTDWLTRTTETFDLIVACDTFIYFGDLGPVVGLAAGRLAEGGVIAFSVERAEAGSHRLTDNGRYVHHPSHLDAAARQADLGVRSRRQALIRMEYGTPVDGLYVCLSKSPPPEDSPAGLAQSSAPVSWPQSGRSPNPVLN